MLFRAVIFQFLVEGEHPFEYSSWRIDIDILFWRDSFISTDSLKIPHPEAENRKFVLVPLNEIAPDFLMPPNGCRVSEILENMADKNNIELYRAKEQYAIH